MSGTKRVYHLEEKNYFKFFGIQEKQDISVRSLTTHYKKIITILKQNEDFLSKDKVQFAHRAFETLVDPIARAKYILELNGVETDVRDSGNPEDFFYIHTFNDRYDNITSSADMDAFILDLKSQTSFIKEEIEFAIDTDLNFKLASGLLNRFYEISKIHEKSKNKKNEIEMGITHVVFDK